MADFTERLPLTDGTNRVIDDPAGPSIVTPILQTLSGGLEAYTSFKEEQAKTRAAEKLEAEKARKSSAEAGVISALYGAQDDVTSAAVGRAQAQQTADSYLQQTSDEVLGRINLGGIDTYQLDEKTGAVFDSGKVDLNPVVEKKTSQAIGDITNFMAAVDQGRMPPISLKSAINGRLRKLFEEYPDQAENILSMINKTDAKDVVFAEIGDVVAEINGNRTLAQNQREDDRQLEQDMFEAGMKGLGELAAIGGANGGPMTRSEIVAAGLRYARINTELELTTKQANLKKLNAEATAEERREAETTAQQEIFRILSGDIHNDAAPIIKMAQQLATSMATDPTGADAPRWEQLGLMANNAVNNWVENAVQIAVQRGSKVDPNTLRSQFKGQFQGLLDNFVGDSSVAQVNHRALQTMTDKLQINVQQALPVFMSLKNAGLRPEEMPAMMEGIQQNPDMAKQLREEIKGFIPEFGQERSSTRLMNIIRILRGEATLANVDPATARQQLKTLLPMSNKLAKDYNRGLAVGEDAFLNSVGELAIATRTLTPSSGYGGHYTAAMALSNTDTRAALIKATKDPNADKAQVAATIQAVRAGNAVILNNVQTNIAKLNQQAGQYYTVRWDNANGRYIIDDSKKRAAIAAARRAGPVGGNAGAVGVSVRGNLGPSVVAIQNTGIPEAMKRWVDAANGSLNNIVELAPHDPTAPKGTALELRRYYGNNQPLKSQQDGEGVVPSKERGKMFDTLEKSLQSIKPDAVDVPPASNPGARSVTGVRGQTVSVPAVTEIASKFANNPNLGLVQSIAQSKGIPVELATRLAFVENKFNHGNTNSAGASGVMQVRGFDPKNNTPVHDTESIRRFGKRVKDLSAQENIELGMDILRRNYEKTGSWKKAVERYLGSGNDGNLTTAQYAELII